MGRSGVVVPVATVAVLPVAAYRGLGAGQPSVLEEVAADALHRRGFAGHPHPGAGGEIRAADAGDKRVAGSHAGRQVAPLDGRAWMIGQREPAVRVGDLDVYLHRRLGGQRLEQLADGGDRGFVTGEEEGERITVDGIAAART